MGRFSVRLGAATVLALALLAVPLTIASAAPPPRGLLPANAHPLGYSIDELALSYMHWIIDSPVQPVECSASDLSPRIWFLPEVTSEGGVPNVECAVPPGTFLVVVPAFWECSSLEPEPFHATTEAELIACVDSGFGFIDTVAITIDGRTSTNLDQYALRTPVMDVPPDNIFGSDPGISMTEGYFAVMSPLSAGTHHARIDATYPAFDFEAITDYTITVG
jgi:hypothetical protein